MTNDSFFYGMLICIYNSMVCLWSNPVLYYDVALLSTPFFLDRPAACFVVCMPAPLRCGNPEMHETFPVHVRANNNIKPFCSGAHLTFQILSQSLIKGSKSQEINHTQDQEAAKQVIIQLISFVPQKVFKYVEGRGKTTFYWPLLSHFNMLPQF